MLYRDCGDNAEIEISDFLGDKQKKSLVAKKKSEICAFIGFVLEYLIFCL